MLKSDFSGQVRGQWTLRSSSMKKTWILKFYPTSPAQPLVRRHSFIVRTIYFLTS